MHHLPDLAGPQQQAQTEVINAGVVADAGKASNTPANERRDGVLRDAAQAEAADHQGHIVLQAIQRHVGIGHHLVHAFMVDMVR